MHVTLQYTCITLALHLHYINFTQTEFYALPLQSNVSVSSDDDGADTDGEVDAKSDGEQAQEAEDESKL